MYRDLGLLWGFREMPQRIPKITHFVTIFKLLVIVCMGCTTCVYFLQQCVFSTPDLDRPIFASHFNLITKALKPKLTKLQRAQVSIQNYERKIYV